MTKGLKILFGASVVAATATAVLFIKLADHFGQEPEDRSYSEEPYDLEEESRMRSLIRKLRSRGRRIKNLERNFDRLDTELTERKKAHSEVSVRIIRVESRLDMIEEILGIQGPTIKKAVDLMAGLEERLGEFEAAVKVLMEDKEERDSRFDDK